MIGIPTLTITTSEYDAEDQPIPGISGRESDGTSKVKIKGKKGKK